MKKLSSGLSPIKLYINNIRKYWREPSKDKYISYKEFFSYSIGGMGVNTLNKLFTNYVPLTASCLLIGSVYGIQPVHLAIMNIIANILNIAKTPFMSMLIDNTNSKYGKFRPYFIYAGIPYAILFVLIAYIPIKSSYSFRCIIITIIYLLLLFCQSLYHTAYLGLAQVLSSDSQERTTVISVSSFVGNLGPSILDVVFPVVAGTMIGGMTNIHSYRVLFPIFAITGVCLGLITFFNTKEKIIVPKDYVARVSFVEGVNQVSKNKYFWLIYFYQSFGAIKLGIQSLTVWYCIYVLQSEAKLSLMYIVLGTASVPGMLFAPVLSKKFGKRNLLITVNVLYVVFTIGMLLAINNVMLFFICLYLSSMPLSMGLILTQSMTADIFDYQQWKTGFRLEGFMTQFGNMIVSAVAAVFNLIPPIFYEKFGLKTDYTVLYNATVRMPVFSVLLISCILGGVLSMLPLFFYNLTEKKHKEYVEELKIRSQR